ncbi:MULTISPECIES: hypothetical protein [Streptomyces]|uniref:hypothetical protein n=1 Tax=Streptomyces TaxID=1883 RepID=UPI00131B7E22|nr:hypothetical protein [Streptomyces sp. NRRL F-5527]
MRVLITIFVLTSAGGTIWLAWFDNRRLRMTDDFAAISGTAILALLVTAFVEVNARMKRAKAALAEYAEIAEEWAGKWPRPMMHNGRDLGLYAQSLSGVTAAWGLVTAILVGDLALVILWACVDGHGPARWLAWFTVLACCYGFVFVTVIALVKVIWDGEEVIELYWDIRRTQRRVWDAAREQRAAELQERRVVRRLEYLASSLRDGTLPPAYARSQIVVHPHAAAERVAEVLRRLPQPSECCHVLEGSHG